MNELFEYEIKYLPFLLQKWWELFHAKGIEIFETPIFALFAKDCMKILFKRNFVKVQSNFSLVSLKISRKIKLKIQTYLY